MAGQDYTTATMKDATLVNASRTVRRFPVLTASMMCRSSIACSVCGGEVCS